MHEPASPTRHLRFGAFDLNLHTGELHKGRTRLRVPDQSIEILKALLEQPGQLVTREELRDRLWSSDTFVDFEHGLNAAVRRLREALGDSADVPKYIETLPRRGYRFIGTIDGAAVSGASVVSQAGAVEPVTLEAVASNPASDVRKWKRTTVVVASVVGALLVIAMPFRHLFSANPADPETKTGREIRSVAILPLKNLSNDSAQAYFVEGMHEALITELAQARTLKVVGRSSAMRYADKNMPLETIVRELKVQALVDGSVLRVGDQVRISVRLLDASSGHTLWAAAFDRGLGDVLALQADVAHAIATELLSATRAPTTSRSTARRVDPAAFELYLKGRFLLNRRGEENLSKAIDHFTNAIARNPSYAVAYAGLADCHNLMPLYGSTSPRDSVPHGRAAALKAIALDDSVAEGHASLAWALLSYDWDWEAADREFQRAIDLDPTYSTARLWYGLAKTWRGRFEEGTAELRRGKELDPVSQVMLQNVAAVSYFARDYDNAIREAEALAQLDETYAGAYVWQGLAQLQKGLRGEAIRSLERAVALSPDASAQIARLAYGYGLTGQRQAALARLASLTSKSRETYVSAVNFATVHIGLGDKQEALRWLEKGLEERATEMLFLKTDARFAPLHSEPRFQRLLERMNFPK